MSEQNQPVILAIDLGTSGIKVALITVQGEVLGWEAEAVQLHLTPDGGVEQSPEEWWAVFVKASARLLGRRLARPGQVIAVCASTQGEGTIPVGRDGKALMNCVLWMDMRGAPCLKKQFHGLINLAGADALRVLRWIRLTGGMPSMTGKDPSAHMLLIRDCFPEIYERTYKFLNVLDYINLRLTGRFTATHDSILTSWVTDNRDLAHIHYDPGLVRASGIEADKLPEIQACTAVLGDLLPEAAEELGLPGGVKVIAGAIDNTAAAVGAGTIDHFLPHLYIGTSSWMAAPVPF